MFRSFLDMSEKTFEIPASSKESVKRHDYPVHADGISVGSGIAGTNRDIVQLRTEDGLMHPFRAYWTLGGDPAIHSPFRLRFIPAQTMFLVLG